MKFHKKASPHQNQTSIMFLSNQPEYINSMQNHLNQALHIFYNIVVLDFEINPQKWEKSTKKPHPTTPTPLSWFFTIDLWVYNHQQFNLYINSAWFYKIVVFNN